MMPINVAISPSFEFFLRHPRQRDLISYIFLRDHLLSTLSYQKIFQWLLHTHTRALLFVVAVHRAKENRCLSIRNQKFVRTSFIRIQLQVSAMRANLQDKRKILRTRSRFIYISYSTIAGRRYESKEFFEQFSLRRKPELSPIVATYLLSARFVR